MLTLSGSNGHVTTVRISSLLAVGHDVDAHIILTLKHAQHLFVGDGMELLVAELALPFFKLTMRETFVEIAKSILLDIQVVGYFSVPPSPQKSTETFLRSAETGGRYWIRTSDLLRVEQAL